MASKNQEGAIIGAQECKKNFLFLFIVISIFQIIHLTIHALNTNVSHHLLIHLQH